MVCCNAVVAPVGVVLVVVVTGVVVLLRWSQLSFLTCSGLLFLLLFCRVVVTFVVL